MSVLWTGAAGRRSRRCRVLRGGVVEVFDAGTWRQTTAHNLQRAALVCAVEHLAAKLERSGQTLEGRP